MKLRLCELCGAKAAIYCSSDVAFLCCTCDAKVHEANFLVARHTRQQICSICSKFTVKVISGAGCSEDHPIICSSCPIDEDLDSISSTTISSGCISRTSSHVKRKSNCKNNRAFEFGSIISSRMNQKLQKSRVDNSEAEGVFVNWFGKLGLENDKVVVSIACCGLKVCLGRWKNVPFRICLAASMWFGLRLGYERSFVTQYMLMRVEEISGVSAKVIVASEVKLARVLRDKRVKPRLMVELEEGWAESQI